MKVGKLPPQLLERLLAKVQSKDPQVLLGPRFGEDAALIDLGDAVLVAKTDPVTFATELIGWYAVQVNANDVATMGARPRWFLASLLLPEGATEAQAEEVFDQVLSACEALNIALVGGHTEVSQGLDHPIVVGCMLGEVQKGKAVTSAGAAVGDAVVITKGIAIEGTAILARDAAQGLRSAGIPERVIALARELLFTPGISVVHDALVACSVAQVHAMHDPTEGGLATGLRELALAAGVGLHIDQGRIPVLPECQAICQALGLDPLGLLASGALVLTLPGDQLPALKTALEREGIEAQEIGVVTPRAEGLRIRTPQGTIPLPSFPRDELARFFSPA
ncbi:MAG: AIR synthase family protein [Dehalococcoidia bacterium]